MVTRRVAVIEWLVAEPVGQRVDAESGLLNEEDAENPGVDEATEPITPKETRNERREDETHEKNDLEVVLVLPDDNWIFIEVGDVGTADSLWVLLHDHPAKVRVEETLANGVWVLVGIGISVVGSVVSCPPSD